MAWWWTGWHVFPIKSLIEYILGSPEYLNQLKTIYRFGTRNSLEQGISKQLPQAYLKFVPIISWKYRRETPLHSRLKNFRDIFLFIIGIFQSLYFLLHYNIDVIFCKWWYVALPIVLAWTLLRKKIIVHESDTHPGLVNRLASRYAKKVFTWFDNILPKSQTIWQIISDELISFKQPTNFPNSLISTNSDKTIILISWWSQWSKKLYRNLIEILEKNPKFQSEFIFFVVLWLLNQDLLTEFANLSNIQTFGFLSQSQMGYLCNISDIGITRAGTTSLAEQKLFDMKLIIIPITRTHDQYDNAKYFSQKYWDVFLDQRDPNFEAQLIHSLNEHIWFKKTTDTRDKKSDIIKAKEAITKSLFNL